MSSTAFAHHLAPSRNPAAAPRLRLPGVRATGFVLAAVLAGMLADAASAPAEAQCRRTCTKKLVMGTCKPVIGPRVPCPVWRKTCERYCTQTSH